MLIGGKFGGTALPTIDCITLRLVGFSYKRSRKKLHIFFITMRKTPTSLRPSAKLGWFNDPPHSSRDATGDELERAKLTRPASPVLLCFDCAPTTLKHRGEISQMPFRPWSASPHFRHWLSTMPFRLSSIQSGTGIYNSVDGYSCKTQTAPMGKVTLILRK